MTYIETTRAKEPLLDRLSPRQLRIVGLTAVTGAVLAGIVAVHDWTTQVAYDTPPAVIVEYVPSPEHQVLAEQQLPTASPIAL